MEKLNSILAWLIMLATTTSLVWAYSEGYLYAIGMTLIWYMVVGRPTVRYWKDFLNKH